MAVGAAFAWYITRRGMVLTPDSMSYLSTAHNIRRGLGVVDFTDQPIAVFPPVFALILAAGDAALGWARVVQIVMAAAFGGLAATLVGRRTSPLTGCIAALAAVLSAGIVRTGSAVWSELTYFVLVLGALWLATRGELVVRRLVAIGVLMAAAVLTRYVGAAGALAVFVTVARRVWPGRERWKRLLVLAVTAVVPVAAWLIRNQIQTGRPTGPRIPGIVDRRRTITTYPSRGVGDLFVSPAAADWQRQLLGWLVILTIVATVVWTMVAVIRRRDRLRSWHPLDAGMLTWVVANPVMVVGSRLLVSSDVDLRMMSPMIVPIVYGAALAVTSPARNLRASSPRIAQIATAVGVGCAAMVMAVGVRDASRYTAAVGRSLARPDPAGELLAATAALPEGQWISNDPYRLWWRTGHQPILPGFLPVVPGMAQMPLSAADLVAAVCRRSAALVWFGYSVYASGLDPAGVRPDLAALVTLVELHRFPADDPFAAGLIYRVEPRPGSCPPASSTGVSNTVPSDSSAAIESVP